MNTYNFVKNFFDYSVAILLMILLMPLLIIISVLIKISSPGSIIYWSQRIGRENKIFLMPKFRTMESETPTLATHLLTNPDKYLIKLYNFNLGSWLRKTSLDELPQLWSIASGKMSFIGPRPALYNQYDLIRARTKKNVHLIKPGLTGLAQINGRDSLSIQEKTEFDQKYLLNRSLKLDTKILSTTLKLVINKNNISH